MERECNHPTCGQTCRREKKAKKIYTLKRTAIKKKPYKIRKYSKKRQKTNRNYDVRARLFRIANPLCKINSPVCTGLTQCVHHLKGKATTELLIDEQWWMPGCWACNTYVEDNSDWAFDNDKKLSKF